MKRLFLPAILALALHGLLLGLDLPRIMKPPVKPPGIPVEIAIRQKAKHAETIKKEPPPKPKQKPTPESPRQRPEEKKAASAPPPSKPTVKKKTAVEKRIVPSPAKAPPSVAKKTEEPPPTPPPEPTAEPALPDNSPQKEAAVEVSEGTRKDETAQAATTTEGLIQRRLAVPAYQQNRQPEYPARAKRSGYQGTVMLKVLVDTKGRVADLQVAESSGHGILDRAALGAVKHWIFSPATENDVPVEMWVQVPIIFQLN